jgi:hypothetical protein
VACRPSPISAFSSRPRALWQGNAFALDGIAVAILALLLIGIADAWDLATYLSNHRRG